MNTPARSIALIALTPLLLLAASGCTAPRSDPDATTTLAINPGDYDRAIDAARAVLIENRFSIDRVDARRGVITTHPKQTAGLATPWDSEQSSMDQEWADLVHQHQRVVRVSFDQSDPGAPTQATVLASIVRTRRPGWRLETESIRHSTHSTALTTNNARVPALMHEPIGEDTALSARLAAEISTRLGAQPISNE